ncbi:MAG: choice-of-anchor L domain-containing protein [Bacteroidota bacterium]|nr:choice-of-anchor L domain-containing protein [Bacteroidota bacterium]
MKKSISAVVVFLLLFQCSFAQIIIDKTAPYDSPTWLIDKILLGGGIVASNHSYQGDSMQVGFFNAIVTNLGLDSGIVMATGDIDLLDPNFIGFGGTPPNTVTDPDLLSVANSVPPLIGQTFSVSSINDVAILEFDFIPTSDTVKFRYVFGSQEYHTFENTQYNDVFGFFLSGPGITGPYSSPPSHPNGSINLAIVPNSNPPLPITISSVHNGQNGTITPLNAQYFVDNSALTFIGDADGFTTVLTATTVVQCGESYHIRLAIADGSDQGLSSYVWLEAGSFTSPTLDIVDNLNIDSTFMEIGCNDSIVLTADGGTGATYQWYDNSNTVISTDSFIVVGSGEYWVEAISGGCSISSDTLIVYVKPPPTFDLGADYNIPCNTTALIDPFVTGGTGNYNYSWNTGSIDTFLTIGQGFYHLTIDDGTGCLAVDSITITEDAPPTATISGGGSVCDDGTMVTIDFDYTGLLPWNLSYTDGTNNITQSSLSASNYKFNTLISGSYTITQVTDVNGCIANAIGLAQVQINPIPNAVISPGNTTIYIGQTITLNTGDFVFYNWYNDADSLMGNTQQIEVNQEGGYYVWVEDANGCTDIAEIVQITLLPKTELFVPTAFTPNGDSHNDVFVIKGDFINSFQMDVVNRWGEVIFSTNSIDKYWDGKFEGQAVTQGSYYYNIKILGVDEKTFVKQGTIEVIY